MPASDWAIRFAAAALVALFGPAAHAIAAEPAPDRRAPPPPPAAPAAPSIAAGNYKCSFAQGNFRYANFRCVVHKDETAKGETRYRLEKQSGSQRIRGQVQPTEKGFQFSGEYFCPHGACDQKVSGTFVRTGRNSYEGTLDSSHEPTKVKLWK